jgi:hypothetical protein
MTTKRLLLPVLLAVYAGFATVSMTILVPMGLPKTAWMMLFLIPGLVVHIGLFAWSAKNDKALHGRLVTGLVAGIVGTIALDVIRLIGVKVGVFGDMPSMFGAMMLTGKPVPQFMMEMMSGKLVPDFSMMGAMIVGYIYHYLNGIGMTTVFMVLFGGLRVSAGVWYALAVELGMMVSPPVMMMDGPFGLKNGPGILIVSLLAHIAWGIVIGVISSRQVEPKGFILSLPAQVQKGQAARGSIAQLFK